MGKQDNHTKMPAKKILCILFFMHIARVCLATDVVDTDYYRAYVNTDGSLDITNKSTGASILSSSPEFFYNYGATTSTAIPVTNNSFEIDDNNDGIPDNWTVDRTWIRLSTEQASNGSKSLKFDANTSDTSYRHAFSSLIMVKEDSKYTISFDSYVSSFTTGMVRVYAYYYETTDGTGSAYESTDWVTVPTQTGYWAHNSFTWTPPTSAESFKIMIFMDMPTIMTVYFDNFAITETTEIYVTDGNQVITGLSTLPKTVTNSSFEIDDNNDSIPDYWTVDKTYIRLSTEQASDGNKSLKFDATSPDTSYRHAYSPLLTIPSNISKYTISIDSYMSSYTSGFVRIYAYYYTTSDGTGNGISSSSLAIPVNTGFWNHLSYDWTPPASAKSFKLMIYMDKPSVMTVYFDNVSVTETTTVYTYTGGVIDHNMVTDGDTTTITATDNNNPYVTAIHQYQLNTHSPYINYTVTLQYKQDVYVSGERFDFNVPSSSAQVMTRDLQLTLFNPSLQYWSSKYTPKVVKFTNGLSFLGTDTMQAMRLQASSGNNQISFFSDYEWDHPHIYYLQNQGGLTSNMNETQRTAGDTYSVSVTFAIDPYESLPSLVKTRAPYGYDAILNFTNHPDGETLPCVKAAAYGSSDENDPCYGTKGIVGRGIGWTKGVFVSTVQYSDANLADPAVKTFTDKLYQDGVEIVGHSITPDTDSRDVVDAGLATLSQYNAKNWIDHSATGGSSNWEDLASQGAIKGNPYYILDLLDKYNYQYAWSYIDYTTDNYAVNMLKPSDTAEIRPWFFYNNRVDANVYDNKKIYLWSTVNTQKTPEYFYTPSHIDSLISERGVHIGHEYVGYKACQNHVWYNDNNTIKICPTFDSQLAYIAQKRADGLIWSPTMAQLGDYLAPWRHVSITYNPDHSITVTNSDSVDMTGITLLAENNIQSVKINNYDLVSFGDSYGSKELVLPTLAAGQSVLLNINYGWKDSSIPTIVSNDTGRNKINEITGYFDDTNQTLYMTAEARDGNYSFTVTMPSGANKIFTVTDVTLNTNIGDFQALFNGAVTFTVPLDSSIHTFKLWKKRSLYIDDFNSYTSDADLQSVWRPHSSVQVYLNTDHNFVYNSNYSMLYQYQANSEVEVDTSDLREQVEHDWTINGVKGLDVSFYGSALNSISPMYVKLSDDSNEGIITYGDHGEDLNDLSIAGWHQWHINLANFSSAGVDLTNVRHMYMGFGDGNGSGNLYFADIHLYQPTTCILSMRSPDFAKVDFAPAGNPCGDCMIDYQEIAAMGNEWLMAPTPDVNADLNGDGVIDFLDYSILANMWLQTQLQP